MKIGDNLEDIINGESTPERGSILRNTRKIDSLKDLKIFKISNYAFQKAKFHIDEKPFKDGKFFLLSESNTFVSPVSCVYYEGYASLHELDGKIESNSGKIQCIVSKNGWYKSSIPLGTAQNPEPWDYADNMDTIEFLLGI